VRWDNLTIDAEERTRLPGYRDEAVVRHFDAPEALDVRFYEVRAKSALNRVPERSRMPFRWTINPYRGCSHACVYCLAGDTPILMADGSTSPLEDLAPGDRIVGTAREGDERRFVVTEVLAHWSTVKPAFRVVLDDGRELVASGDHRFLTARGWAYVAGAPDGAGARATLAPGSLLMGTRGSPAPRALVAAREPALVGAGGGAATAAPVIAARAPCDAPRVRASGRVVAVVPLDAALELYDITTGTGDFVANGVVSHNCFARQTHTYLDMNAGRDFEREIVVKVNAPEVLRTELARPSWKGEHVAMGTNTDPYQWVEGRYKLMRGIWAALRDFANPCSVLTKSPLLLRDLDLMKEIAAVTDIAANLSIPTMDEKPWRASEPHTPSPKARIEAVAELNRAGIPTGILVAPLMPGINDDPRQVERILQAAGEAGAVGVSGIALHLRGEVRGIFMEWLRSYRPDLVGRYEALYRRGAYAPNVEQDRLRRLLTSSYTKTGHDPPRRSPADSRGVRRPPSAAPDGPARPPLPTLVRVQPSSASADRDGWAATMRRADSPEAAERDGSNADERESDGASAETRERNRAAATPERDRAGGRARERAAAAETRERDGAAPKARERDGAAAQPPQRDGVATEARERERAAAPRGRDGAATDARQRDRAAAPPARDGATTDASEPERAAAPPARDGATTDASETERAAAPRGRDGPARSRPARQEALF
jgi:DNA repair photolyase